MQLSEIRHRDAERVRELMLPKLDEVPRSLIIQGLPGCGGEQVFADLGAWLRTEWVRAGNRILVEKNLATFWVKPVAHLVRSIRGDVRGTSPDAAISGKTETAEVELETELVQMRGDVLRHAQAGGQVIFMLDNFDVLLKFPEPDQVQNLLNTFQSLGYEHQYRTAFIVCCHRDIEDICQAVNYSDFHKIFATNHHRVSRVSSQEIERFVCQQFPEHDSRQIESIVSLSAGYPEHAELLLRCTGPEEEISRQAVDALALIFEEWMSCLTADEQQVVELVVHGQTLGYEHLFAQKKLLRKEVLVEKDGITRIVSPLFASHLMARVGKTRDDRVPCVRKASLLSDVHCSLLEQLFQGRYYLEWRFLQSPRPGDATVYLISGEDRRGVNYRPCIVKIHRSDVIDQELNRTAKARDLLGPAVPTVLAQASLKGQKAVIFEYATVENRSFEVYQFAEFYRTQPTERVVNLLRRLFSQVLWPFYQTQLNRSRSASRLYFLPRLDQGEFDKLAEIARRSHFYDPDRDAFALPGWQEPLSHPATILRPGDNDPTYAYHKLFLEKRDAGLCLVHGDVNPRNFLIDGVGNIHLIDFAAMKEEGGRFLDLTRLEAEIKFKLTDVSSLEELLSLVAVERLLAEACDDTALTMVANLPFADEVAKMVAAVATLRRVARSICQEKIEDTDFELEYKTALLAQTLRLSLHEDYLDGLQQEFAVISAALVTQHLLKLI